MESEITRFRTPDKYEWGRTRVAIRGFIRGETVEETVRYCGLKKFELKKFGSGYICRDSFFKKLGINLFYRKVARRWSVSIVEKNNNSWKECGTCRGMQIVLFRNAHNVHDFIQRAGGVI